MSRDTHTEPEANVLVRQPCAIVDNIPQSGTENLASGEI
jgi:hypothetical protein